MDKIITTIKREWLREIIAKRKKTEYRKIKPYWQTRLADIKVPFQLRLINGMQKNAPEATVEVLRIKKNRAGGQYELQLGKILNVKNWNKRQERPTTRGK
jgi:hypothetical protein